MRIFDMPELLNFQDYIEIEGELNLIDDFLKKG